MLRIAVLPYESFQERLSAIVVVVVTWISATIFTTGICCAYIRREPVGLAIADHDMPSSTFTSGESLNVGYFFRGVLSLGCGSIGNKEPANGENR